MGGKKTTRIFHTLFDGKYGLFFALAGADGKIMGDFALAGPERVCVFCDLFAFSVLQFPDVGVVLTDGAVG